MTRHADAKTLARFRQGDLSPRRGSGIRAHLAGCERCRALDEDLAGVTTLLAAAKPPPIPEHLAARIQNALAAEAANRPALTAGAAARGAGADAARLAEPSAAVPSSGRRARHERPGRGRRQSWLPSPIALRTLAAAAAVVVLAGGGYEIAQHSGGSSSTASSPSMGQAPLSHPASGPAGSAAPPPELHLHVGRQGNVPAITSHTNYAPATLESQVRTELTQHPPLTPAARPGRSASAAGPLAASGPAEELGNIPVARLQGCVSRIAAGQPVLLVDVARYQGAPATVIVTSASAGGAEQVWVVGEGCSSSDVLAHVTLGAGG